MLPESRESAMPARLAEFERQLEAAWPAAAWRDLHVVVAVSGGADSVALLRAMQAVKARSGGLGQVFAAHLHHGLRGDEADQDAAWVQSLCDGLQLSCIVERAGVATLADLRGDGWEAAARTARYEFLQRTAEQHGARFVVTAHTADDLVETVLHRIVRGTGLAGLAGIPKSRPLSESVTLIRPLLGLWRADVVAYLTTIGQEYRSDSSNRDMLFTRNRIRHELLPLLQRAFNEEVDTALVRLATQAAEVQQLLESTASSLVRECVTIERDRTMPGTQHASRMRLECSGLRDQPLVMIREVCKAAWQQAGWPVQAMGFDEWQLLAAMVAEEGPTAASLPRGVLVRRSDGVVVFTAM